MVKVVVGVEEVVVVVGMDEEEKGSNDNLQTQINEMNAKITKLSSGNISNDSGMDKEKQEFKDWIEKQLKLPEYYDVLVENGIDKLSVVQLLTKDELQEMGITKIGHKIQILKEIQSLKQRSDNQPAEGGTAYI